MRPRSSDLAQLLRRLRQLPTEERHVPAAQVAAYEAVLFPSPPRSTRPARGGLADYRRPVEQWVSPGWMQALDLVELAMYAPVSGSSSSPSLLSTPSERRGDCAMAHRLLERGRFPPQGWAVSLRLLRRWRSSRPTPDTTTEAAGFPPVLSEDALYALLHQLSCCPPANQPTAWSEALQLYESAVRASTTTSATASATPHHRQNTAAVAEGGPLLRCPPPSTASLRNMRHVVLTTLLKADQWVAALHFYRHVLYQAEAPSPSSTGFLFQRLGEAGRWEEVLQLFDLCVRLVAAQRNRLLDKETRPDRFTEVERLGRRWGTAFSMAMAAVSASHADSVPSMLASITAATAAQTVSGGHSVSVSDGARLTGPDVPVLPLTLLDGNFLAAVERLTSEQLRLQLLRQARQARLLDHYKLIRGLTSQRKWATAMAVFAEAMAAVPPLLSRREIGQSRLHLLHAADAHNVAGIVAAVNRVRGGSKPSHPLALNDAEVECVLSKTLKARRGNDESVRSDTLPAVRGIAADDSFWVYALAILQANYPACLNTTSVATTAHSRVRETVRPRRTPSAQMISLLLHQPTLPWRTALQLVTGALERSLPTASPAPRSTPPSPETLPPAALMLNTAAQLLYAQGQRSRADDLACRVVHEYGCSPIADFLQLGSAETVRNTLLRHEVVVSYQVVYHVLHTATAALTTTPAASSHSPREGGAPSPLPSPAAQAARALTVVHVLMEKSCGVGFLPAGQQREVGLCTTPQAVASGAVVEKRTATASWLMCAPGSVHCEVFKLVFAATGSDCAARWGLTVAYLRQLSFYRPDKGSDRRSQRQPTAAEAFNSDGAVRYYSAAYEAVLNLLAVPAADTANAQHVARGNDVTVATPSSHLPDMPATSSQKLSFLFDVLELTVVRHRCSPPTHMLLPNQLDRLLPRQTTHSAPVCGVELTERVAVAHQLILFAVETLKQRVAVEGREAAEPAMLHNLLKLCCRVAEFEAFTGERRSGRDLFRGALRHTPLSTIACELLHLHAVWCGRGTLRNHSLPLLYQLCAAEGGTSQWVQALKATASLVGPTGPEEAKEQASTSRGGGRHSQPAMGVVTPSHYRLFQSLFGWERGLLFWYRHLPRVVLANVSHHPHAVDLCLAADDGTQTGNGPHKTP